MGLMLGEFMVGGFLCAFGTLTGKPVYSFWPYQVLLLKLEIPNKGVGFEYFPLATVCNSRPELQGEKDSPAYANQKGKSQ